MVTRKDLLNNVRNYSPQEIAEAVRSGVVSLYDLTKETEGAFTPILRRQVKTILDSPVPQTTITNEQELSKVEIQESEAALIPVAPPSITASETSIPVLEPLIPVVSLTEPVADDGVNEQPASSLSQSSTHSTEKKPAMFSNVLSFKGRIRRLEYGLTFLASFLWEITMQVMMETQVYEVYAIIYLATLIPILWIWFAQGAKRCHDIGNSGWYQIIPFYFFWMILAEGNSETNEYGVSPK